MNYGFYLTSGAVTAAVIAAALLIPLFITAVIGIKKTIELERSIADVRYRPAKQNADL